MEERGTIGLYIPSYKRYNNIMTHNILPNAIYVVRDTEKDKYVEALGGREEIVWACPDDEINSLAKVRQYIIDNAKEDVIIEIDDDISSIEIISGEISNKLNEEEILNEFEKISQLIVDLNIGHASLLMGSAKPLSYQGDFKFVGLTGGVCWFNKKDMKGKYVTDGTTYTKEDQDFVLQELLLNRIILCPQYLGMHNKCDVNSGGNNTNKNVNAIKKTVDAMQNKWGKYFEHNYKNNNSKVNVKRNAPSKFKNN